MVKEDEYVGFAGAMSDSEKVKSVYGSPRAIRLKAVDYSQVSDRRITDVRTWGYTYRNKLVRDIVLSYLNEEGFYLTTVLAENGPMVDEFKVEDESLSDALNRLCQADSIVLAD